MGDSKHSMVLRRETPELPPPSYTDIVRSSTVILTSSSSSAEPQRSLSDPTVFKPIVIPQVSHSLRGAFMSPFCRAYAPSLSTPPKSTALNPAQFLLFIDGINNALISSPGFQATSLVGNFISHLPLPIVPLLGTGITASAGAASSATCLARAKTYANAANDEIFLKRGLRCRILKTRNMMQAVGCGSDILVLPPLQEGMGRGDCDAPDDLRMRRIRAMGDRVAELKFDGLPGPEDTEGWWKKLGVKEAQKKDDRIRGMLMQRREQGFEGMLKKSRQAEEETARYDQKVERLARERVRVERGFMGENDMEFEDSVRVEETIRRELRKLDEEVQKVLKEKDRRIGAMTREGEKEMREAEKKEHEIAQKIYWIVIDRADVLADDAGVGVQDDI